MKTYVEYWNLRSRPFEAVFADEFFFSGNHHREALERLLYLIRDGDMGFGLLTGEIGCGKSMVASILRGRLRGRECQTVMLENSYGDFDDLLREIMTGLKSAPGMRYRPRRRVAFSESRYAMIARFREVLEQKFMRLRRRLVIILDEAQQLSEEALIEMKNLTNFTSRGENYLSIILVGQPELGELVHSLPQIDQRVGLRYHLQPLSESGVGEYVDWRMRAAGYTAEPSLFTDAAKHALFVVTEGVPREINRICKLALDRTFSLQHDRVEDDVVQSIAEDTIRQHAWSL